MSTSSTWHDVKAKARAADPTWDTDERVSRRSRTREEMLASISGAQFAEIRTDQHRVRPAVGCGH